MKCSILTIFMSFMVSHTALGAVIYVDDDAPLGGDGLSWDTAYRFLQDGLADANSLAPEPVEIRVAQGVYRPDRSEEHPEGTGDRNAAFELIGGVALEGGFAGLGAVDPSVCDVDLYRTVLSGDLKDNDAPYDDVREAIGYGFSAWEAFGTWMDNSHSIVKVHDVTDLTVLAGVLVAHSSPSILPELPRLSESPAGGGVVVKRSKASFDQCTFTENIARSEVSGGGVTVLEESEILLTGCLITHNSNVTRKAWPWAGVGAGLFTSGSVVTLVRSDISFNLADVGGGITGQKSTIAATGCLFAHNLANNRIFADGGAISQGGFSILLLKNCQFVGNKAEYAGAIDVGRVLAGGPVSQSTCVIQGCLFAGNCGTRGPGVLGGKAKKIVVENCTMTLNRSAIWPPFGPSLKSDIPFKNCIIWDNTFDGIIRTKLTFVNSCLEPSLIDLHVGSCIQCIQEDPGFVNPGFWEDNNTPDDFEDDVFVPGDYHLQSQAGHWDQAAGTWVQDGVTSPCIDTGHSGTPIGLEPFPNGGRVNMGAYGGTVQASKSFFGEPICETIVAGDINGDCRVDFKDLAILTGNWLFDYASLVISIEEPNEIPWPLRPER